jgi:hypothetical protein
MGIFALFLFTNLMKAEYRAFLLVLKNENGEIVRQWSSTLDPIQYRDFYPVPLGHSLTYQSTWMCYGPTLDFKKICNDPKALPETTNENPSP